MKFLVNIGLLLVSLSAHPNTELMYDDENDDNVVCIIRRPDGDFDNTPNAEQLKNDLNDLRNMYMLPLGQIKNNCQDFCIKSPRGFFSKIGKTKVDYH